MKILFASDSFKGTLSSKKINELLMEAALEIFPGCRTKGVEIADGGEGTVSAVTAAAGGRLCALDVHGPLMETVRASYGLLKEDSAVIEMAAASGLPLVPDSLRNPLNTTSYGTGELIRDALEKGCKNIAVAIGGSATNDGGIGAMKALGVRFFDRTGKELSGVGADLEKIADIDMDGLCKEVTESTITVMCDVNNPLTGPEGATYTFGKQKGGTPQILDRLERGMENYSSVLKDKLKLDVGTMPGAGAAGGMGAALCGFLGAGLQSGIETVLDLIDFDSLLEDTDLVVTGEGRIDWQSAFGKVPGGVGMRCKKRGIPVIAVVGGIGPGAEKIYEYGIDSIISTINGAMQMKEALERAEELYMSAARRAFRMVRAGMKMKK